MINIQLKFIQIQKNTGDKKKYEINKFVYWPSTTAKRLNCTDFTLNNDGNADTEKWRTETDGIGGIRKIRNQNGAAIIILQCTKFLIYEILDNGQGYLNVYYNGKSDSNTTRSPDGTKRENALIYESPEFDYSAISVTLKPSDGALIVYCIFYEVPPIPTQTPIPISVGLTDTACKNRNNCGSYSTPSNVEYDEDSDFGCSTTLKFSTGIQMRYKVLGKSNDDFLYFQRCQIWYFWKI